MDTLPSQLCLIAVFILITALYRSAENAVDNVSEAKIAKLAEDGNPKAARLLRLLQAPNQLYDSIRLVIILTELIVSAFTATKFAFWVQEHTALSPFLSVFVSIAGLAVILLIFGVYIPRRLAMKYDENIALALSGVLQITYYIGKPFVFVLSGIANLIVRLFGITNKDMDEDVTEEEIRMMVDIGSESGAIDPEEKEMIHNIFEMDDTPARDIMTHRTDVDLLWLEDGIGEWEKTISESNHSIYPVCGESVDDIRGILNSRDFYKMLRNNQTDVNAILRTPYFVPESIKAKDLFRQMQKNKTHFSVVLDEYGGLGGIISMADLLEEIVGSLSNEYDEQEDELTQIDENTWRILGSADIDLVSEALHVDLPVEEYNTFAGMILGELGSIPEDGTTPELEAYNLQIRVTRIEDHRIEEALVCVVDKPPAAEEKDG